jgi:hypothetical protein
MPDVPVVPDAETPTDSSYSSAWMRRAVQARVQAERATADPRREIREFLASPLDMGYTDILLWWKVSVIHIPKTN